MDHMIASRVLPEKIVNIVFCRGAIFSPIKPTSRLFFLAKSNLKATSLTFICDKSGAKTT
jgi:hypothetical protein